MEGDVITPKPKKWKRDEVTELFRQGKSFDEIFQITGLKSKVLAGIKGYLKSPLYEGPPIEFKEDRQQDNRLVGHEPRQDTGQDGHQGDPEPGPQPSPQSPPQLQVTAGPTDEQIMRVLQGKPYLVAVRNVYVSPATLACYQYTSAKGFAGSIGEFLEACVLKLFKDRYNLIPGLISPPQPQPQTLMIAPATEGFP